MFLIPARRSWLCIQPSSSRRAIVVLTLLNYPADRQSNRIVCWSIKRFMQQLHMPLRTLPAYPHLTWCDNAYNSETMHSFVYAQRSQCPLRFVPVRHIRPLLRNCRRCFCTFKHRHVGVSGRRIHAHLRAGRRRSCTLNPRTVCAGRRHGLSLRRTYQRRIRACLSWSRR